jgi:short-subunit dehydrogenase
MTRRQLTFLGLLAGSVAGMAIGSATNANRRYRFTNRTVVITGGSRGLGLALARVFAREGARLALLARDEPRLEQAKRELELMGAEVEVIACDLRSQEEVRHAIQRVVARFDGIDVLINNAGVIQVGPLDHMTLEDFELAMAIHYYAPLYTVLAALPYLREARGGRIVNIASIGGKIAVPHLLPYSASKFALVGLSDGLRAELRRNNIFVTTVCPGLMRTGSPPGALFKGRHRKEYTWFALGASTPLLSMNADRAARRIVEACRKGSARLILGSHTKAAVLANELFPETAATLLALTNRLLPNADMGAGFESHQGRASESALSASWLTSLTRKAAAIYNQQPAE